MKCDMHSDMLTAYFDGECSPDEMRLVETHLTGCSCCRSLLLEWQGLRDRLSSIGRGEIQAPAELRLKVMRALDEGQAAKRAAFKRSLIKKWLPAAAGFLLMSGATWAMLEDSWHYKMPVVASQGNQTVQGDSVVKPGTETAPAVKPEIDAAAPDKSAQAPGVNVAGTVPGDTVKNHTGNTGAATAPKSATKTSNDRELAAMAFLSTGKYTYSGYLQVKDSETADLSTRIRSLATGYAADVVEEGNIIRLNVPTARYTACYDDLSGLLADRNSAQVIDRGSNKESLDGSYRNVLAALEKVRAEMTGGSITDDRLSQLQRDEDNLLDQLEDLEQRAATSVIVVKLN